MKPFEELTYRGQLWRLRKVAQAALSAYGLTGATLNFIGRSENTTFRVDMPGYKPAESEDKGYVPGRYLLRVHRPGYQTEASINSELEWLSALRRDAGLIVPESVPALDGALLTKVAVPGIPEERTCSLLRWVRGRFFRRGRRPGHFRALGRLMARLHQHTSRWQSPEEFTRRHWDWDGLFGDAAGFNLAASDVWKLLPQPYYGPFRQVADETQQVMDKLGKGPDVLGLIHADLLLGVNVLLSGGEAYPIDFDDCGYGYWVYDFATSLCYWREAAQWQEVRDALFEGYAEIRPLPYEQLVYVDLFITARRASEILWAIDMAQVNPDFQENIADWLAEAGQQVERYIARR
ncbi:MAG: phosphotransferase [Anaerolineae bacterium]|nr:phosphotransferase [Anaerolineae bacterium]